MLSVSSKFSSWNSIGNTDSYTGITCASGRLGGWSSAFDNVGLESLSGFNWNNLVSINPHAINSNMIVHEVARDAARVVIAMDDVDSILFRLGLSRPELLKTAIIKIAKVTEMPDW